LQFSKICKKIMHDRLRDFKCIYGGAMCVLQDRVKGTRSIGPTCDTRAHAKPRAQQQSWCAEIRSGKTRVVGRAPCTGQRSRPMCAEIDRKTHRGSCAANEYAPFLDPDRVASSFLYCCDTRKRAICRLISAVRAF
jgi:hypothetical protein